jgi:transposase
VAQRSLTLFCLKQAHAGYVFLTDQIVELDTEIERRMRELAPPPVPTTDPKPKPKAAVARCGAIPGLLERLFGVDLCTIPGFSAGAVHTLWAELGTDLSAFPTAKHFCSWLSLCPNNKISGGRILSVSTRASANRVAKALRLAAQALWRAKNELGEYYRRMRAKLGGAAAITATAHKLARIAYAMIKSKQPYDSTPHDTTSELHRLRTLNRLKAKAKELGYLVVEAPQSA